MDEKDRILAALDETTLLGYFPMSSEILSSYLYLPVADPGYI